MYNETQRWKTNEPKERHMVNGHMKISTNLGQSNLHLIKYDHYDVIHVGCHRVVS